MYDVVLLVEREMTALDAEQVSSLHEAVEETVRYHVLMPVEDAAVRLETSMGALAGHDFVGPVSALDGQDIQRVQDECSRNAEAGVASCCRLMKASGHEAIGTVTPHDPIDALAAKVAEVEAAEAIILTRPHVVQGFFHLDWTSRARRKLHVPILHLLEHETFEEQASGAEGAAGM